MKDVIQKQVAKTLEMAEQLVESLSVILIVMIINKKFIETHESEIIYTNIASKWKKGQ